MQFGILKFQEHYMERLWGGDKLTRVLKRTVHQPGPVGEAWLISDHVSCESVVASGEFEGRSLRDLMDMDASAILGAQAQHTSQGRFPLLLKLIDAGDVLSVQVHPDDTKALRLGESDTGKTEMWYVIDAEDKSALFSGLCAGVTRDSFKAALNAGDVAPLLRGFSVSAGDGVFVNAGAVHAIGAGKLLAEIQQNSDITYRLFDWKRVDENGVPRTLHIEKAMAVMDFAIDHGGRVAPLRYTEGGVVREVLSACSYFAAERICVRGGAAFEGTGRSFHILMAVDDVVTLVAENSGCVLEQGEAALIPASVNEWRIKGTSNVLDYYVPALELDIIAPLRRHGYSDMQLRMLLGAAR